MACLVGRQAIHHTFGWCWLLVLIVGWLADIVGRQNDADISVDNGGPCGVALISKTQALVQY